MRLCAPHHGFLDPICGKDGAFLDIYSRGRESSFELPYIIPI